MEVNFDTVIERRNTNCTKYDGLQSAYGKSDLLPLWIADMDFPVPDAVTDAIKRRALHPVYGYNTIPAGYFESFANWEKRRHNWDVNPDWVCHTPGVLSALSAAILAFTERGDNVLIQPPVYFPFSSTIETLQRNVQYNQLIYNEGRFTIDFDDLEKKAEKAKLFVFCSPHNPSGRVWTREELLRVEQICRKNDLMVFSDEIHSDIVYPPNCHIVFADLSEWSREHSIIAMAPSKTFNLAGLEISFVTVPNQQNRKEFQHLLRFGLHIANPNAFGIAAAQAAYESGEEWYQELLDYLQGNLYFLDAELKERVPDVRLVRPEATYIPLLDMKSFRKTPEELNDFMVNRVGAALNVGSTFGPGGESFMRINVATQRINLNRFVEQLHAAIEDPT